MGFEAGRRAHYEGPTPGAAALCRRAVGVGLWLTPGEDRTTCQVPVTALRGGVPSLPENLSPQGGGNRKSKRAQLTGPVPIFGARSVHEAPAPRSMPLLDGSLCALGTRHRRHAAPSGQTPTPTPPSVSPHRRKHPLRSDAIGANGPRRSPGSVTAARCTPVAARGARTLRGETGTGRQPFGAGVPKRKHRQRGQRWRRSEARNSKVDGGRSERQRADQKVKI